MLGTRICARARSGPRCLETADSGAERVVERHTTSSSSLLTSDDLGIMATLANPSPKITIIPAQIEKQLVAMPNGPAERERSEAKAVIAHPAL